MEGKMEINRISLTLPNEILEKSEEIAKERMEDRSTVIRELLRIGIKQHMMNQAVILYSEGKINLGKASETAGVSLWKFLDILKDRKVPLKYSQDDIKNEIKKICS